MTSFLGPYLILLAFTAWLTGQVAVVDRKPEVFPPIWVFRKLTKEKASGVGVNQVRFAVLCAVLSFPLIPVLLLVRLYFAYIKWERKWAEKIGKGSK